MNKSGSATSRSKNECVSSKPSKKGFASNRSKIEFVSSKNRSAFDNSNSSKSAKGKLSKKGYDSSK